MSSSCVVLGAGIIGVCTALRLAQQGASVTLVDGVAPAAGTTGTSGSMVGANEKRPHSYYRLGVASMAAMRRLADELDHDEWFLPTGHLEWASGPATTALLAERVARLREWDYPCHHLTPAQVVRDLEPDLRIPADVDEVVFFSDDSIVHPHLLIALLLRRCAAAGVRFCFGEGRATIEDGPDGVRGVRTAAGTRIPADVVVSCVGRWTQDVLADVGVKIPMVSPWDATPEALGLQVVTTPVPVEVRRMVRMPGLSIRPAGGGRLLLHGRPEEAEIHTAGPGQDIDWDTPFVPPPPQAEALVAKARAVLPHAGAARVQSATPSVRALTADGLPVAGWVTDGPGLYVIVTHSGIGLGPLLGELAAGEIGGRESPQLADFRPGRFLDDTWRSAPSPMRTPVAAEAPTN